MLFLSVATATAQNDDMVARWNKPIEPFQLIDNIYYVGTNEMGAYLITGDEGHILIDGGFEETAPIILKNVETLGFDIEDVEILLNSHAHFDHAAGLAALKKASGAKLYISKEDTDIIERGGKDDYLLGNSGLFPAVAVDHQLNDKEEVKLGETRLTAHVTAGHTQGCTTWSLQVENAGVMLDVVIVCSVTVLPNARLIIEPSYPGIANDFHKTFEILESLPCDVFLAPHGQFIDLENKIKKLKEEPEVNPFIDPDRYTAYVARGKKRFLERLAKEKAEG